MSAIRLRGIVKSFGKSESVLRELNLDVSAGEMVSVVGPSGAGKTTLLRVIAGLESLDTGEVFFGERNVTKAPPEVRDVAFVFQNHALYPHLTVAENLAFPLHLRGVSKADIGSRVAGIADLLGIAAFLGRRPSELSGGEAQRVALGRALIREPAVLLMDEPLSSLPLDLRFRLRNELLRIHKSDKRTILYVTHDQEEALALGQRVAVLNGGAIQQLGEPREIYERPANRFIAGFIGRPSMNFFAEPFDELPIRGTQTESILVGIRPEDLRVSQPGWFSARVQQIHYLGASSDVILKYRDEEVILRCHDSRNFKIGDVLGLSAEPDRVHFFDARSGERLNPQLA